MVFIIHHTFNSTTIPKDIYCNPRDNRCCFTWLLHSYNVSFLQTIVVPNDETLLSNASSKSRLDFASKVEILSQKFQKCLSFSRFASGALGILVSRVGYLAPIDVNKNHR